MRGGRVVVGCVADARHTPTSNNGPRQRTQGEFVTRSETRPKRKHARAQTTVARTRECCSHSIDRRRAKGPRLLRRVPGSGARFGGSTPRRVGSFFFQLHLAPNRVNQYACRGWHTTQSNPWPFLVAADPTLTSPSHAQTGEAPARLGACRIQEAHQRGETPAKGNAALLLSASRLAARAAHLPRASKSGQPAPWALPLNRPWG